MWPSTGLGAVPLSGNADVGKADAWRAGIRRFPGRPSLKGSPSCVTMRGPQDGKGQRKGSGLRFCNFA